MQKTLIFDFDGTLVRTQDLVIHLYNVYANKHGLQTITHHNLEELKKHSFIENVKALNVPLWRLPLIVLFVKRHLKHEIKNMIVPHEVHIVLKLFQEKGYGLCVVSSNAQEVIEGCFTENNITCFSEIHAVSRMFGKADVLKKIVTKHNLDVKDTYYIGDEVRDIEAAHAAGVQAVAVTWGYNDIELLKKHNPEMILNAYQELEQL